MGWFPGTVIPGRGRDLLAVRVNGSSRHAAIRPLDRLFALHAIGKAGSEPRLPARRSSAVEGVAKVASPHCFQVAKQPSGPCSKTPCGRSTGPDTCGGGRAGPAGLSSSAPGLCPRGASSTSPCQSWQQICAPRHSYVSLGGQPPPSGDPAHQAK